MIPRISPLCFSVADQHQFLHSHSTPHSLPSLHPTFPQMKPRLIALFDVDGTLTAHPKVVLDQYRDFSGFGEIPFYLTFAFAIPISSYYSGYAEVHAGTSKVIRNSADFEIIFEKKNLSSEAGCSMYHQLAETAARKNGMSLKSMTRFSLKVGTRLIACDMWMIFMKFTSLETKLTTEEMTMRYMNQSKPWGTQNMLFVGEVITNSTFSNSMALVESVTKGDPSTNAGRGSNLTEDGHVECDASIIDGDSGLFGADGVVFEMVSKLLLCWPRNKCWGQHCWVKCLPCACMWAISKGSTMCHLNTNGDHDQLCTLTVPEDDCIMDTVGVICVDTEGHLRCGVSSGGITLKYNWTSQAGLGSACMIVLRYVMQDSSQHSTDKSVGTLVVQAQAPITRPK
ncbi:unnamed protein product [Camellia sinensis]